MQFLVTQVLKRFEQNSTYLYEFHTLGNKIKGDEISRKQVEPNYISMY